MRRAVLADAAQLALGFVVLALVERAEETGAPLAAQAWLAVSRGAGQVAAVAGRVALGAEARYYRAVSP